MPLSADDLAVPSRRTGWAMAAPWFVGALLDVPVVAWLLDAGPLALLGARLLAALLAAVLCRLSAGASEPRGAVVSAALLVAALPVVGWLLLGTACVGRRAAVVPASRHLAWSDPVRWDNPRLKVSPPLPAEAPEVLARRLSDPGSPPALRLHALMRARELSSRLQNRLATQALSDGQDEIRLFAFSLVDRLRATHERQIEEARAALAKASTPEATARAQVLLAEALWEAVYVGLYEDSAQRDACQEALAALGAAGRLTPPTATAELLRGRILLLRGDDAAAATALAEARKRGAPASKVLPYAAECSFRRRAFAELGAHLAELRQIDEAASFLPPSFTPLMEHWL